MFDITYIVMLVAIGIGGGVIGSIIGVGGGIIFTPILTLMSLPPTQVASTSLVAVAFTSISSATSYARQRRIKYAIASKLAVLSIPGAVLGAYLSAVISEDYFKLFFSIVLIIAVGYILFSSRMKHSIAEKKPRLNPYPLIYCCAFAAGVVSSLFGVGGGIIFVPILLILMRMKMYEAAPASQFIIMISAITGLAIHIMLGHPHYVYALSLASGAFAGGAIGAELSAYLKERLLRIILSVTLLSVSTKLIFDVLYDK